MLNKLKYLFLLLFVCSIRLSFAYEALGGEITWTCAGGSSFRFQLVVYRDCNSEDITTAVEQLRVWNHPTLSAIPVNLLLRQNLTPVCTQNANSPAPLSCGIGDNGGNGLGTVEKLIFESAPINITGIPPAEGWIFTYESTARKSSLSNIANPALNGMTISAKMFQIAEVQNQCMDNSPQILENPYWIICAGSPYLYMPNVLDVDLDSVAVTLVNPLNNFPTGTFNPPTNPLPTSYNASYSALSPTPSSAINPSNTNMQIDPNFGDLTFTSFTPGEFCVKFLVKSFRNGHLIAEVEREMVVFVVNCIGSNNTPIINPSPELANSFFGSFTVGSLVSFTSSSSDNEFLQDGVTPQNNVANMSGLNTSGFTAVNGPFASNINLDWQTNCSQLQNQFGNEYSKATFHYVLRVDDDFCQIPKSSFQRFTIELSNADFIVPAQIDCINTLANGDLQINWNQVADPNGNFVAYELYSIQSGLISTIPTIGTTTFTVPAINASHDFYLKTRSGSPCSIGLSSDTVSNMQLSLNNPNDGTATLTWNTPFTTSTPGTSTYTVLIENPPGTWTPLATLPYGVNQFIDTIEVCSANLSYQIIYNDVVCNHTSSIETDLLSDRIAPFAPVIQLVSIDTLTNLATITWSVPNNTDIEGYVIYFNNVEFDTVLGQMNNTYTFPIQNNDVIFNFSVAAYDFCTSQFNPLFHQTSGRSQPHSTVLLNSSFDVCTQQAILTFTDYLAWNKVDTVILFYQKNGGAWIAADTLTDFSGGNVFSLTSDEFVNYVFVVQMFDSASNNRSFSNTIDLFTTSTSKPSFNYINVATVVGDLIEIHHDIEQVSGVSELVLERETEQGTFNEIQRVPMAANVLFVDENVDVQQKAYRYQVRVIDSCGNPGLTSNVVRTILLEVKTDNLRMSNFLSWNRYEGFNGSILYYNVHKGVDGVFNGFPIATVPQDQLFFEDTANFSVDFSGRICYYIETVEAINVFGFQKRSYSNVVCPVFEPLIYIPNAFTPNDDDFNQYYKPVVSLVDIADYEFVIFDRWGQVMFQTTNKDEAWDGNAGYSNKKAELGVYTYVLKVRDGSGQEVIKRGHLSLVR